MAPQDTTLTPEAASRAAKDATSPMLALNNVEVIYDHVILVLKGVSLTVPRGGIVAILGANGAVERNPDGAGLMRVRLGRRTLSLALDAAGKVMVATV
jgi:ABC-type uncharacterized transport system ATPase subunit